MPNHISNKLLVTANSHEELEKFLLSIKGNEIVDDEEQLIDFNRIIPMPLPLRTTQSSSMVDDAIYYHLVKSGQEELVNTILRCPQCYNMERYSNKTEQELAEMYEIGEKYVGYFNEFGAKDWYDWSIKNWGTKWNAYSSILEVKDEYSVELSFQTAWSGVPDIISKLTEMFPTFTFEYEYADEDMGYNCGSGYGEDGEFSFLMLQGGSEDAIKTYARCWGYDEDCFYFKDGCWHNSEWDDEDDEDYDEDDE